MKLKFKKDRNCLVDKYVRVTGVEPVQLSQNFIGL